MTKVKIIQTLFEKLVAKTGCSLSYSGFNGMENAIDAADSTGRGGVSSRYLNDLLGKVRKAGNDPNAIIKVHLHKMDLLTQFLGYKNFTHFCIEVEEAVPTELKNCVGNWYSYVRYNAGAYLLSAPVRIYFRTENEIWMELKGSEHTFKGRLTLRMKCLFAQLEAENDKILHLVFKLGSVKLPKVLQGVFTGISSAGDPIAGRELLIRTEPDCSYEKMIWEKIPLEAVADKRLQDYFKEASGNNIKINKAAAFDWEDLTG